MSLGIGEPYLLINLKLTSVCKYLVNIARYIESFENIVQ